MNSNPVRDVTPIVGLVQLSNGEEFERDQRKATSTRLLGATTLEEGDLRFCSRLESVYSNLTNDQCLCLASKHNLSTTIHYDITTCV